MKFYSFDYMESKKKEPRICCDNLKFERFSEQVEVAETVDLNDPPYSAYRKITIVRVKNNGELIELAFRCFAGITEDEEDVSVHLYRMESYERVFRTIRLHKKDNSVEAEAYYAIPDFRFPPDAESEKLKYEDWELTYGCMAEHVKDSRGKRR